MSPSSIRRVIHVGSALVLLLAHFGSFAMLRYSLATGAVVALLLDLLRLSRPAFGLFVINLVPVFRESESRRLSGATWLCIGYAAAAWFPQPAATAGILVGAFADPAASLVGSTVAAEGGRKTWAGSGAAAVVAALVLLSVGIPPVTALIGSVVAMALERWSGLLNDNLVVPPGVALTVLLL